jgi:bacteriocin-like protein
MKSLDKISDIKSFIELDDAELANVNGGDDWHDYGNPWLNGLELIGVIAENGSDYYGAHYGRP